MKRKAELPWRGLPLLSLFLLGSLLSGCPDPDPDPDPDPEPVPAVGFLVPQRLATDEAPEAVAIALINNDAFPDLVTANRADNTLTSWIADGADGFTTGQRLLTRATEPRAVALGDLDEDGNVDIVSANSGSNNLSVLYGAGNGTFSTAELLALADGAEPRDVAILDVNEDGHLDLVSANSGLASISVLTGDGARAFAAPLNLSTGDGPRALLVADVNNDTRADLICTDRDDNALSLFINEADGNFRTRLSLPTGQTPRMTLAKDLDNDGWLDLVVSNPGSSNIAVHIGAGNGAFDTAVFVPTKSHPTRIALGDFTGDGEDDVLAILFDDLDDTLSSGEIQCLAGDGEGDFEPFDLYYAGPGVVALAVGDLDRDGKLDVAACNVDQDRLLIAAGSSNNGLAMERRFATGERPRMIATADFNRDGDPDVAVANLDSANISILLGDGKGAFGESTEISAGGPARALATADFNGDNRADLAVTNLEQSRVAVFIGQGDGDFEAPQFYSVREGDSAGTAEPRSLAVADLDEDGNLDLVTGNAARDSVAVLLGDGEGAFGEATEFDAGNFPLDVHLVDLDENGNLDLVLVNGIDEDGDGAPISALRIIPGKGDGTFDVANDVGYVTGLGPNSVAVADWDSDGDLDAATCHNSLDNLQLFSGRGDGAFSAGGLLAAGDAPNAAGVADFNEDGQLDLFSTNDNGRITIRLSRQGLLFESAISVSVGTRPIQALAVDLNDDDHIDIIVPNRDTNNVSVLLGTGPAD